LRALLPYAGKHARAAARAVDDSVAARRSERVPPHEVLRRIAGRRSERGDGTDADALTTRGAGTQSARVASDKREA
jgi:hypothetical protein